MDPFSITVGIVGLVDGGLSLASKLKDLILTFRHAEHELVELAHEVDLTISLVGILGDNLDQPENAYPKKIVQQTKTLIEDIKHVFGEIRGIVDKFECSTAGSAGYVLKAGDLKGHQAKIKGLQLSFVFMLAVCPAQRQSSGGVGVANASAQGQLGSFEGTIQQFPVEYNHPRGNVNQGVPVTYQATLTLRPSGGLNAPPGLPNQEKQGAEQPTPTSTLTETLEAARKDKELKKKLANLSRSPFFPTDFFSPIAHKLKKRRPHVEAVTYDDVVIIEKITAAKPERRTTEARRYEEVRKSEEKKTKEMDERAGVRMPTSREAKSTVNNIFEYLLDDLDSDDESEAESVEAIIPKTGDTVKVEVIPVPPNDNDPQQQHEEGHCRRPSAPESGSKFPVASDRPSPSTGSRTQTPLPGYYPPESDTLRPSSKGFTCDGCEEKYGNISRYKCGICDDFDFCESCFEDPKKTLRHPHAKPEFLPIIKE